jgi:pimeloyl-ACP methyl ester carboxylesterase
MVAYSYLRGFDDVARVVIMDVVIPGLDPWDEVLRNPYLWHFAMHSIPALPELLVQGLQAPYFDYFYRAISAEPSKITAAARSDYVAAYKSDSALTAGFNWYRAFPQDAEDNRATKGRTVSTPLLYLRGEHEGGDINAYVVGLRDAGVSFLEHEVVSGAGHFTQEEAPVPTWELIAHFIGL